VARVHSTAIIEQGCELAEDVEVGPFSLLRNGTIVGAGSIIDAHVLLEHTTVGAACHIGYGTALGGAPQDLGYKDESTRVLIGERTVIREYVTIHRATGEGNATRIGSDCLLMASTHLGHNCQVGNHVTIATLSGMSGHTIIEDRVTIGGMVGSHQRVRVGTYAMVSGFSKMSQDIPPYALADGKPARVIGPNSVGLRRSGINAVTRQAIQHAFRVIYRSGLELAKALELVQDEAGTIPEIAYLVDFLSRMRNGRVGRQHEVVPYSCD
jgi:UDP-N-acetylglucosamine acyltransferase